MRYVIGIDGGGTKTTAILATAEGRVVGSGSGGPGNFQAVGEAAVRAAMATAVDAALRDAEAVAREGVVAVAAGLAGLHVHADYERFAAIAGALLPTARVTIVNDGQVALAAATGGRPGIVVVAGTGSIGFGVDAAGRYERCGGWGYLIGDEGSAYAIVRHALHAASYAADGRAPASALVDAFTQALGVTAFDDILRPVYGPPPLTRHQLAALAPLVGACAAQGDAAARAVLARAGADLATLAVTLAERLGLGAEPFPVACSGGVWAAGASAMAPFRAAVQAACPRAMVGFPVLTPAAGAALLAIGSLRPAASLDGAIERLRLTHAYEAQ